MQPKASAQVSAGNASPSRTSGLVTVKRSAEAGTPLRTLPYPYSEGSIGGVAGAAASGTATATATVTPVVVSGDCFIGSS